MLRAGVLTVTAALLLAPAAPAQTGAVRFRWQPGQVLTYRVEQATTASDVTADGKVETTTKLGNLKRWQVLAVDPQGVATLQLSLAALRIETTSPKGEVLLFDSANLDKSNPQMRDQLAQYVGPPLAVLRIDARGQVVEVKESKHGPASRFESEQPFVIALPEDGPKAGQSWERSYHVTLDPPQGTGEKYDAVQKYTCKAAGDAVVITLSTALKTQPENVLDRVPLLQM